MNRKQKWLIKPTGEYNGGSIAGMGLGFMIGPLILVLTGMETRSLFILGFVLLVLGGGIALHYQQKDRSGT